VHDNIVIMLDFDPRIEPVQVDPGQLDQVVVNLVVNSADALPNGGTISLETSNPTLTEGDVATYPYVTPGGYVSLIVRDNGAGMDEAVRTRAFEPFFTTKPIGKGTGLGLSTVYGIVKQSGGYVWVASAPGAGTAVTVWLPVANPEETVA
jgi:signal transduction histidine kinase